MPVDPSLLDLRDDPDFENGSEEPELDELDSDVEPPEGEGAPVMEASSAAGAPIEPETTVRPTAASEKGDEVSSAIDVLAQDEQERLDRQEKDRQEAERAAAAREATKRKHELALASAVRQAREAGVDVDQIVLGSRDEESPLEQDAMMTLASLGDPGKAVKQLAEQFPEEDTEAIGDAVAAAQRRAHEYLRSS